MSHRREQVALGVYVACFALGAAFHLRDFIADAPFPYRFGPLPLQVFWTALLPLDVATASAILFGRRRTGVTLALATMVGDVAANSYAWLGLRMWQFGYAVQLQSLFLGFVVGSAPPLWQGRRR